MAKATNGPASTKKKVALVDDHPLIRQGVGLLISQESDLEVCGEAETARDALELFEKTNPDVAVVDLTLKESSGLELIKDAHIRCPKMRILVLSMRDEGFYAERVLRAGARGYITKEEGPKKVLAGIRRVLAGEICISDRIASKLMSKIIQGPRDAAEEGLTLDTLTDRELEIFELVGNGLPTREISKRLHISTKTVDSHREHIKSKLKLESAAELLKHAIQWVQCQKKT